MRVAELKALARERGLRGYSRLRRAELIASLQNNPPLWSRPQRPERLRQQQLDAKQPSGVQAPAGLVNKKWIYLNNKR